jgi:hypothetical protein
LEIIQSKKAEAGDIFEVSLTIRDDIVPEPNPHKGVLCALVPADWQLLSGAYEGAIGQGTMELSSAWADSAERCFPAAEFGKNMRWIGMLSDTGYTYNEPIEVNVSIRFRVGDRTGCFDLGYLTTKATTDLICSGNPQWAAFSYPHELAISTDANDCTGRTLEVERASDWGALLDRNSGWTGADGIYSIPLSGFDAPGEAAPETTLFVFSDTFIGEVDSTGRRQAGARLVNNPLALANGNRPDPENTRFIWGRAGDEPTTLFVPQTPNSKPGDWYWLMDGIAIDDKVYVFGLRLELGSGGVFNFRIVGVSLLSFGLDTEGKPVNIQQSDSPLFYRNDQENWEIVLGQAVMSMTFDSGNPGVDGYIYIYGPRNHPFGKELVVARVLPEDFEDFSTWTYWNGQEWSEDISVSAPLTNGISQEFSVTPINEGRFLVVFQRSNYVAMRSGESPVGPFGVIENIWLCPEVSIAPGVFVYNAKAHPHLSDPGELLISYNVNTFNFADHFTIADIYRPRFINLRLQEDDPTSVFDEEPHSPESFTLLQNYPNPFNPHTTISFSLAVGGEVKVVVTNILGQTIAVLHQGVLPAGPQELTWDGRDNSGLDAASGVYIYSIEAVAVSGKSFTESRKMLLLR